MFVRIPVILEPQTKNFHQVSTFKLFLWEEVEELGNGLLSLFHPLYIKHHYHNMMLPLPCLIVGPVFFSFKTSSSLLQTFFLSLWPKAQYLFCLTIKLLQKTFGSFIQVDCVAFGEEASFWFSTLSVNVSSLWTFTAVPSVLITWWY